MKKILAIVLIVMMLGSFTSCKSGNSFNAEFNSIVDSINEMNTASDYATAVISGVWNAAGPDHVVDVLQDMLAATEVKDIVLEYYVYEGVTGKELRAGADGRYHLTSDQEDVIMETCRAFQKNYPIIKVLNEEIKIEIKNLKEKFSNKYTNELSALTEYYLESSTYASFASEPSGSLNSYNSTMQNHQSNIAKLKQNVELYT